MTMEGSIQPRSLTLLQGGRNQESVDSALQPSTKWGCREEEQAIIKTIKSLIHDLDFPMCLWVEACLTMVYILNRCLDIVLEDKTPEEAFTGEKPQVTHLCFRLFCLYSYS
jgi:hypothetical protein